MIRFSKPNITEKDTIDVKKVLKSGWLAHGEYTKKLENFLPQKIEPEGNSEENRRTRTSNRMTKKTT